MVNIVAVLGPVVLGIAFSLALFGVFTMQVWVYFIAFPKDRVWLKSMVFSMWLVDFVNAILLTCALFTLCVVNFGNPDSLGRLPPTFTVGFFLSIFIDFQCQAFLGYRLWKICGKAWMAGVCGILIITKAVTGLVASYNLMVTGSVEEFTEHWTWPINVTLGAATANDVFIAVTLSYALWNKRTGTGFTRGTVQVLERLVRWTVHTGLLISIVTVATNVSFNTMKSNLVWVGLHLLLPRVYSNSVLACLNGRTILHAKHHTSVLKYGTDGQLRSPEKLSMPTAFMVHSERERDGPSPMVFNSGFTGSSQMEMRSPVTTYMSSTGPDSREVRVNV
ncbi:hypothetical protein BDV98DRAFT_602714 [Pterulicium gracile]|uniref:DUF6534 domain-containing protein n=1 Tax=Pterulicium gracile TaxID=1884261 RepID=A0A5C3QRX2_9AGAR|nr:hypothetical protein BDV98DRAFT_602714 [Pterula gracilis]